MSKRLITVLVLIGLLVFLAAPIRISRSRLDWRIVYNDGDSTAGIQDAIDSLPVGGGTVYVPGGDHLTSVAINLPSDVSIIGAGRKSRIYTTTDNLVLLQAADASRIRVEKILLEGNNTASATNNGIGLHFTRCDDVLVRDVYFEKLGGRSLWIQNNEATAHKNFRIEHAQFSINAQDTDGGRNEIHVSGNVEDVYIVGSRFIADSTTPKDVGVSIANSGAELNAWNNFNVSDSFFDGYARGAVYTTGEDVIAAFSIGVVTIENNTIMNSLQQGIKLKATRRVRIINNYLENNDTATEDPGNLQGTIHVNISPDAVVSGNIIVSAGTNAIRIQGLATVSGGDDAGVGRSPWVISNNVIRDSAEDAIFVAINAYQASIVGNTMLGCAGGILVTGTPTPDPGERPEAISIIGNNIRNTPGNDGGIALVNVDIAALSGNIVRDCGGFGLVINGSTNVTVTGDIYLDNGVGTTNTQGIRVTGTSSDIILNGIRSGNLDGVTQEHGIGFGGTNPRVQVINCNLEGNNTAAMTGTWIAALADDATPSVAGSDTWLTGGTTTITDLSDGYVGQRITIISEHSVTISDNANFFLAGGDGAGAANYAMTATDTLTLIQKVDTFWYELDRSVN